MSKPPGTESFKRKRDNDNTPPLYHIFQGEVASVKEYGIFVKIPGYQRQGLVHKSQISKSRVDDPSEMFAKGEMVYCKVISLDNDGEKIGLAMKTVNQTTGADQDVNNIELGQDERRRKKMDGRGGRQKIELGAVLDTICKKCGGSGHLAQECFKFGNSSYELIPELEEYTKTLKDESEEEKSPKKLKKAKKDKKKKKKKEKKKKSHRSSSSSSDLEDRHRKEKRRHSHKHRRESNTSSDNG